MPTAQEVFEALNRRDMELLRKSSAENLGVLADEILQLSRDCAKGYRSLRGAELFDDAEKLRGLAYFWSIRYKQATGKPEYADIVDWRAVA